MAKKSEKNEGRRESLRKVKDRPKKEPNETPKKKAKGARKAETPKQKAKEAKKAKVDLTLEEEAFRKQNIEHIRRLKEDLELDKEMRLRWERVENEIAVNTLLDIGYVFRPEEGKLLDYFLKKKIMDVHMDYCPIKEANVYESHPQALTGKSKVWYFFTCSRASETQPGTEDQGRWILGEKEDVFYQDEKVGVKQVVEYWEAGHKSEYKILEYQLDPAPDYTKTGPWFVCKLYNDVLGGPQDYVKGGQRTDSMGKMQATVEDVPCRNTVAGFGLDALLP